MPTLKRVSTILLSNDRGCDRGKQIIFVYRRRSLRVLHGIFHNIAYGYNTVPEGRHNVKRLNSIIIFWKMWYGGHFSLFYNAPSVRFIVTVTVIIPAKYDCIFRGIVAKVVCKFILPVVIRSANFI